MNNKMYSLFLINFFLSHTSINTTNIYHIRDNLHENKKRKLSAIEHPLKRYEMLYTKRTQHCEKLRKKAYNQERLNKFDHLNDK